MIASNSQVVLCDFSWLLYKYHYAYRNFSVYLDGEVVPTGQVFGFARLLESLKIGLDRKMIFCLDSPPETRKELFPEYKAHRHGCKDAIYSAQNYIYTVLACCPEVSFIKTPDKEADDVLANTAFHLKEQGFDVVVFSGDNDMLQLLPFGIKVSREFTNHKVEGFSFSYLGNDYISEKFGVSPEDLLYYRIMVGDSSDGIPPPVPRLNRNFIKGFIKVWREKSLNEALADESLPSKYREKVSQALPSLQRNMDLMTLSKYAELQNRFPLDYMEVSPCTDLIDRLRLSQYSKYLSYLR